MNGSGFVLKTSFMALTCALSLQLGVARSAAADVAITFGTYAADKPTAVVRQFKPFLEFLEGALQESLGEPVKIKMKVTKEYQDSIDQLVNGEVDFSRFGPASYVTAKARNPDISIIAIESVKGKKTFKGVIAVRTDSDIQTLADLKDNSFAFGDELSTIGRYLAQSELLDAGISADELSSFEYLGRHDLVGTAVGNGSFTAGALKESTFKKLVEKGVPIRALATFDNVTKPWIASSKMSPRVFDAMKTILLDPANLELMKSVSKNGMLEGEDADYEPIRNAMDQSTSF